MQGGSFLAGPSEEKSQRFICLCVDDGVIFCLTDLTDCELQGGFYK